VLCVELAYKDHRREPQNLETPEFLIPHHQHITEEQHDELYNII
jgi:hypothetical protein